MNIAGKRALVTGGSSGIGLEIARELLARGARVIITGRRAQRVEQAVEELGSNGRVGGVVADIVLPEGRRMTLERTLDAMGGVDILVNNAGGVRAGRLEDTQENEIRQMLEVNLTAPILLTRLVLPALLASGEAVIVNVSSSIAKVGLPFYATYAASKAGIAHFGESLRRELDGEGVSVVTVYPTATDTPMMATTSMSPSTGREAAVDVARDTVDAIADGRLEVVRGDAERLAMIALNSTDPKAVDRTMAPMKLSLLAAVRDHSAL
jgi:uncharacterized oxidoreductase